MSDPDTWQTPAALAVVAVTAIVFAVRIARGRAKGKRGGGGGCGGGCACPGKPSLPPEKREEPPRE